MEMECLHINKTRFKRGSDINTKGGTERNEIQGSLWSSGDDPPKTVYQSNH